MTKTIDLSADMGESFDSWQKGDDNALLDIVTSANIACGFHAGDWDVMAATMQQAVKKGVNIGAHPGFPDLQGFGRQRMTFSHASLGNLVRYQIGAAQAMAHAAGGDVKHLKLHGALANMCAEDEAMATACYDAALSVAPDLIIMVIAGTAQHSATQALNCKFACEIFADRAYNDDATLVDRKLPGAVIHDPGTAADRIVEMVKADAIIAASGRKIPTSIDTICLHGDTPGALEIAKSVRNALVNEAITIAPLSHLDRQSFATGRAG